MSRFFFFFFQLVLWPSVKRRDQRHFAKQGREWGVSSPRQPVNTRRLCPVCQVSINRSWTVTKSVQGDFGLCVKWVSTLAGQSLSQYRETLSCVSTDLGQLLSQYKETLSYVICVKWVSTDLEHSLLQSAWVSHVSMTIGWSWSVTHAVSITIRQLCPVSVTMNWSWTNTISTRQICPVLDLG